MYGDYLFIVRVIKMSETKTHIYRAQDGVIQMALGRGGTPFVLARCKEWTLEVTSVLEGYWEIGRRFPVAQIEGNADINGAIKKAAWDASMLRLAIGSSDPTNRLRDILASQSNPLTVMSEQNFARRLPEFSISGSVRSEVEEAIVLQVAVTGCKLGKWSMGIISNEFVMEDCSYKGTGFIINSLYRLSGDLAPKPPRTDW